MKKGLLCVFLVVGLLAAAATPALSLSYLVYDQWGGSWHDANKTAANTEDDLMCWAAAASNVLAWGKWGTSTYNTTDKIFKHFQDHWTDDVGWSYYGLRWWLNGAPPDSASGSKVDVPGGGGFYPGAVFENYIGSAKYYNKMQSIDDLLTRGYTATATINKSTTGHVVTAWGFGYDLVNGQKVYNSIYITDSDDNFFGLKQYPLIFQSNRYFLGGGYSGWYISSVNGMKFNNLAAGGDVVPLPGGLLLLGTGLLIVLGYRQRPGFSG